MPQSSNPDSLFDKFPFEGSPEPQRPLVTSTQTSENNTELQGETKEHGLNVDTGGDKRMDIGERSPESSHREHERDTANPNTPKDDRQLSASGQEPVSIVAGTSVEKSHSQGKNL